MHYQAPHCSLSLLLKAVAVLQAHVLDQLPTDLVIEVLRCAPGTISSQPRRLPRSLSSLAALAAFPAPAAACTLPCERQGAASDLPTLTLCVDVGQAGDADEAALASAETSSHNSDLVCGSSAAQGSIWVHYDDESELADETSLYSLQQRPDVVACPLLARSDSLIDLLLQLPHGTCLVLDSGSAVLDVRRAKFEGVSPHSPVLNPLHCTHTPALSSLGWPSAACWWVALSLIQPP